MTDKAKQLVVASLCKFEPNHEIYRELLGDSATGQALAEGVRVTKEDVLAMKFGSKPIFEFPQVISNIDRIAQMLSANGEQFTLRDLTRSLAGQRSILDWAERHDALQKLFSPEVWAGRDAEMQAAWHHTSRFSRNSVNFLSLRRAVAAATGATLRADHLADIGLPATELTVLLRRGDTEVIESRLAPHGEKLRREDVMALDEHGETMFTYKDAWNQLGKIAAALEKSGEPLGINDFQFRVAYNDTLLDCARKFDMLPKLFSPAIWKGRPEEMLDLARSMPNHEVFMQNTDLHGVLANVLDASAQGTAWQKQPVTRASLTAEFNCRAQANTDVKISFRPLALKNVWDSMGTIRSSLRAANEKITLDDLRQGSGLEGENSLRNAVRYGRLTEVLDILAESGERLTIDDFTKRRSSNSQNLLDLIHETKQTETLLRPALWVGRGKDLQEVWKAMPAPARDKVDFSAILTEVNRLSLREIARQRNQPKP